MIKDLTEALKRAAADFEALSPEAKAARHQAQRLSFARAMQPCEHGVADFEDCPDCREKSK